MGSYRRYTKDPAELVASLSHLIEHREEYPGSDLIFRLLDIAFDLVRDRADRGDLKMLHHALVELRYAFKVFAPYRMVRKVAIFGSARTVRGQPEYLLAQEFANRITRLGYMVITGAGPGIMEAAQGGAGRAKSFGVNIRLPFESKANDVIDNDPKLVHFKYFFTRKVVFIKESDAVVIFPGGFGTHDEAFESLTLVQTGKGELLPVVFVDQPGGTYWGEWLRYIRTHLEKRGFIDTHDASLFKVTDSIDEAADTVHRFYSNYHSSRRVHPRLILRLRYPVSDPLLERLNDEFRDILARGRIERLAGPLRVEADEPHTHNLYRLALHHDRRSFGRLRQMVDLLNDAGPAEWL